MAASTQKFQFRLHVRSRLGNFSGGSVGPAEPAGTAKKASHKSFANSRCIDGTLLAPSVFSLPRCWPACVLTSETSRSLPKRLRNHLPPFHDGLGGRPRTPKRHHSPGKSETGNETHSSLEWRTAYPDHPLARPVTSSGMRLLVESYVIPTPHPLQTHNKVNYITSPSSVIAWLGDIREEMGVCHPIPLLSPQPDAKNTPGRTGRHASARRRRASVVRAGHASLSKHAVAMYDWRHEKEAQMYGIGVKEAWRVEEEKHVPGVRRAAFSFSSPFRSLFFPLFIPFYSTPRGQSTPHPRLDALRTHLRWEYHMADCLVSIILVVGLNYKNWYIES
ncbi:hypothetical protein K438DRAFT_1983920 [Mycena galopus ATCC 62051]|nr:hypothetical protein K438DRAFT_1983920 [Mycena galopus ATCC 62051]